MREQIKQSIVELFAKRKPNWPPEPLVIKAWTDHLLNKDHMTPEKVDAGCRVLGDSTADVHLGSLVQAIDYAVAAATRAADEKKRAETKHESDAGGVPKPYKLVIEYYDKVAAFSFLGKNQTNDEAKTQLKQGIIDACRDEARKHPKGSEMRRLWVSAGKAWLPDNVEAAA